MSPQLQLVSEHKADQRRENLPTADEVAVILPDEWSGSGRRDVILTLRASEEGNQGYTFISSDHGAFMPLHFVLFFLMGNQDGTGDNSLRISIIDGRELDYTSESTIDSVYISVTENRGCYSTAKTISRIYYDGICNFRSE